VHRRGRGMLPGWWWPIEPKVFVYQMAAPFPKIMYGSLCNKYWLKQTTASLIRFYWKVTFSL
jgi:hypothetical protein